jgi:hypothetical protein
METTKCIWRRGIYPIYIGERGQPPMRGAASPTPFVLFMVVVTPPSWKGNPPHKMSNPHFNFA